MIGGGLSKGMVTLFAVAAGLAVANIYYAQPLLTSIASSFHVGSGIASLIVTAGQIGYALGLSLLVPLGDVVNRRRLVVTLLLVVAAAQAVSAVAPSIAVLVVAAAVLSFNAVVAPILVAFAATLAATEERGRVTGRMMGGVLMGVLLARTGGGLVAQWGGGWRTVYAVAAVLMLVLAATLYRQLPYLQPAERLRYPALLGSVVKIMLEEPLLRLRCAYGFLTFAGFTAFWTSYAFLLAAPPYSYREALIGLFGLVGVVGVLAARVTGRFTDHGREGVATAGLLGAILLSWVFLAVDDGRWLPGLVLGVVILDLGVQGMQVTNLSVIYRRRPEARSRITTAYMTVYFLGGFVGAGASGAAYAVSGWSTVCLVGAGFAALALLLHVASELVGRRFRGRSEMVGLPSSLLPASDSFQKTDP